MLLYVKKFLSIFVSETGGLGSMTSFTREFVTETNITVDSIVNYLNNLYIFKVFIIFNYFKIIAGRN